MFCVFCQRFNSICTKNLLFREQHSVNYFSGKCKFMSIEQNFVLFYRFLLIHTCQKCLETVCSFKGEFPLQELICLHVQLFYPEVLFISIFFLYGIDIKQNITRFPFEN